MRPSRLREPLNCFRMRQLVRDVREPRAPRLQLADEREGLLDGLVHRMRHVTQRVENQVIQVGEQQLRRIRNRAENP